MYLVIYDISDDPLRTKVAAFLKSKGLTRIQYSAFVGKLTSSQLRDVVAGVKLLTRGRDSERLNVQVFPITESQYEQRTVIGKTYGEEDVVVT
ncbi:CRISPR-associated protein Cas2 [Sulfodiicoccus acidiphilus]|uniref:CRISPR-associated endoribonuclease Cas2 n=1 Tax=Sulfodiicoccus acidiphilus TaxID=1670455 RepID=A0A348B5A7_9CREN|nr:CRISPR-associated endonuclease Cas2 [Sulfodiicoccus acidiphilus]BBD73359.1 CRISPR-associated protein Cas2 [Sulfodiicoccus acidiphilus]GGU00920.1 CRISPR-associated protein Cas2 [Sulfodiicoccus acidiphilus]